MEHDFVIQYSIFLVYFGAALLATVALFTRQALPVVYILLGALVGPGGFQVLPDLQLVEQISNIGIVFLLFLLGLDLYPQKLINLFRSVSFVATASSIIFFLAAFAITIAFGFTFIEAVVVGIASMFSSTIIGLKLLPTTVLHHRHIGELVIGVLLLQDVLALFAIVFLQGLALSVHFQWVSLLPILLLPIFVVFAFLLERFFIRRLLMKFEQIQEYVFIVTIGWCLGLSQLADFIGLTFEIGAFIAGVALAASPISRYIANYLRPIRDFFMVLFFVSVGAHFNMQSTAAVIVPAVAMAVAMLALKPVTFKYLLGRISESKETSWEVGFRLGQLSEFSILLALLAVTFGEVGNNAANLIILATVLTFIGSSYLVVFRYPSPVAVSERLRRD